MNLVLFLHEYTSLGFYNSYGMDLVGENHSFIYSFILETYIAPLQETISQRLRGRGTDV